MSHTTEAPAASRKSRCISRCFTTTEFDPDNAALARPDGRYPHHALWVDYHRARLYRLYFGDVPEYDIATGVNGLSSRDVDQLLSHPQHVDSTNYMNEVNAFGHALREQAKKDGFLQMATNMDYCISMIHYRAPFFGPEAFERFENEAARVLQPNEIRLLLCPDGETIAAALIPLPALNRLPTPPKYPNTPPSYVAGSGVDPTGWTRYSIE